MQHAIEPDDDSFRILGHVVCLHGLQQAFLHDVRGQFRITGARTNKTDEGIEMGNQRIGVHIPKIRGERGDFML